MSIAHTWRAAKPGQRCQEPHCAASAMWALVVVGARSEELLCDDCAAHNAKLFDLTSPNNSTDPRGCASSPPAAVEASARHAGAEANPSPEVKTVLTSPQTSEAVDATNINGLGTNHSGQL